MCVFMSMRVCVCECLCAWVCVHVYKHMVSISGEM